MSLEEPNVYIYVDASRLAPTQLAEGGNALLIGTANKGPLNSSCYVGQDTFTDGYNYEEHTFGSIGPSSGSNVLSLIRSAHIATKDSRAGIWGVRVASTDAAQASGTITISTSGGIALTSYYKGTWYNGNLRISSGTPLADGTETYKVLITGSDSETHITWEEYWDYVPSGTTVLEMVSIINGTFLTSPTNIAHKIVSADLGAGTAAYTTVNGSITPTVVGSYFYTAATSGSTDAEIGAPVSQVALAGGDNGEVVTATDMNAIHRSLFANKQKYDILHFCGLTSEDCGTEITNAIEDAASERCWRIAVQGRDEPVTDTEAAAVTEYTSDTTYNNGYIKWASRWKEHQYDPYEYVVARTTDSDTVSTITLDSKWTAPWYVGETVKADSNGIVDESVPITGSVLFGHKPYYEWNKTQIKSLLKGKITFTAPLTENDSYVIRSQSAYGLQPNDSSFRNVNVTRMINGLKKTLVNTLKPFTRNQKNLPRVRSSIAMKTRQILERYLESEKITGFKGLKVYASPDDVNNGIVRVDFDIKPVQPVLFIMVNVVLE